MQEPELRILHLLVDRNRGGVDVGGNKGAYADVLSSLVRRLVVYEPLPDMAAALRRRLPKRVDIRTFAVSDRVGAAVLRTPVVDGVRKKALSSLVTGATGQFVEIKVKLAMLDELADEDIGFVKIDVEGHECAVLRGATSLIRNQRPVFLVEAEDRHVPDAVDTVRRLMESFGYVGHFLKGNVLYPISDFGPMFQHPDILKLPAEEIEVNYTNNFLFFPDREHAAASAQAINEFLRKKRRK